MSKYGIEFLKNPALLQTDKELPDYQFHENGYLFLASSTSGLSLLNENNEVQREAGVSWMQLMNPSELNDKFSWLNTQGITGGSFGTSNEGYFDPWGLLSALKKKVGLICAKYIAIIIFCLFT